MDISSFDSDPRRRPCGAKRWAGDEDRARPMRRSVLLRAAGGLALIVALVCLVLAYEAFQARGALTRAEDQARDLRQHVSHGDVDAARSDLAEFKDSTREAASHTDGPLWYVAARTPLVGQNFAAVQEVSRVLHMIAKDGLTPLVDIADQVNADAFSPRNGRIDIEAIRELSPGLQTADRALTRGWRELQAIDGDTLFGPLQGPVTDLQAKIDDARATVVAGSKASQLLPDMLGGSGQRSYILAFQNNAEIRSTGGLPGAYAIMRAKDGRIKLELKEPDRASSASGVSRSGQRRTRSGFTRSCSPVSGVTRRSPPTFLGRRRSCAQCSAKSEIRRRTG